MENNGKQWKTMENNEKQRKTMENNGKQLFIQRKRVEDMHAVI